MPFSKPLQPGTLSNKQKIMKQWLVNCSFESKSFLEAQGETRMNSFPNEKRFFLLTAFSPYLTESLRFPPLFWPCVPLEAARTAKASMMPCTSHADFKATRGEWSACLRRLWT